MNKRKDRLDMFQAVYAALRPRLGEILNEEIDEQMHFADYRIVKE